MTMVEPSAKVTLWLLMLPGQYVPDGTGLGGNVAVQVVAVGGVNPASGSGAATAPVFTGMSMLPPGLSGCAKNACEPHEFVALQPSITALPLTIVAFVLGEL